MNKIFYEVLKTDGYEDDTIAYYADKTNAEKRQKREEQKMDEAQRQYESVIVYTHTFEDLRDE